MTLRAALASMHTLDGYNTPRTHRRFLQRLGQIVPPASRPIVVTDASFRGPRFLAVEALGWDWIGARAQRRELQRRQGRELAVDDDAVPIGHGEAALGGTLPARQAPPVRRHAVSDQKVIVASRDDRSGVTGTAIRRTWRGVDTRKPWLQATSLVPSPGRLGRRVVKWYARRMQIELSFRDAKGTRWGWQLPYSGSRRVERLNVLLLSEMLATFVSWLVGLADDRHSGTGGPMIVGGVRRAH